jgi:pimeloyl-ACP methyl ester carboxylesterase
MSYIAGKIILQRTSERDKAVKIFAEVRSRSFSRCITADEIGFLPMNHLLIVFICLLLTASCAVAEPPATGPVADPLEALEARTLYYPRAYDQADIDSFIHAGGTRLDYKTAQGNQTAWLITPARNAKVERLWVVCGGNGVLALEMARFCNQTGLKSDAFVLVDYPGYGCCEGYSSPQSIRENVKASVLAAGKKVEIDPEKNPELVCGFGHSLGCAAALMAVEEFHLKSAVLCSPFTSTHEMAELRTGLAKDAPFAHQFDNRLGLKELEKNGGTCWIIHGADDRIIPVSMSKTLAEEFKEVVKLTVIPDAGHNDIFYAAKKEIADAMTAARKGKSDRPASNVQLRTSK